MACIFLSIVMILMVNDKASSINYTATDSYNSTDVSHYIETIYTKGIEIDPVWPWTSYDTDLPLVRLMNDLNAMSSHDVADLMGNELQHIAQMLLKNIEVDEKFQDVRVSLIKHITDVEFWYGESLKFNNNEYRSYSDYALKNFIKSVLRGKHSLPRALSDIYNLINPATRQSTNSTFLSVALQYIENNHERLCDRYVSLQMQAYYIFMHIIRIELQGFGTIFRAYLLQHLSNNDFNTIINKKRYTVIRTAFNRRLKNYYTLFINAVGQFPRDIRRCDVENPRLGVNTLELEGLFQVIVRYRCEMSRKLGLGQFCVAEKCEDLKPNLQMSYHVHNCKTSKNIKGCPEKNSQGRFRFSWWKTDSETNGHPNNCSNSMYELSRHRQGFAYNDICVCSVDLTNSSFVFDFDISFLNIVRPKVVRISKEPQLSNIAKNMIVVGVKFVLHNNAIHLQIKQAKVSRGGYFASESSWKPVNIDNNNNTISISYGVFHDRRNILYLDHVLVDPNHVVTGVRFQEAEGGKGFELHVHSTRFNYNTGQLDGSHKWHKPGANPVNAMDYHRNRMEIVLNDPDVPTMAPYNHPDLISNKFIQFQHSSIHKDAGYHVVPFFDAQPVETSPEFPLSGIGLFHRGLDGFGGYIAPQLFTQDLTWAIRSAFEKWQG